MTTPNLPELRPEVLAAFYGQTPLLSALPHFASRAALLEAYARHQVATFGPATAHSDRCDLCHAESPTIAVLDIAWSARLRWYPSRVALLIMALPVLIPLALGHLGFVLAPLLNRIRLEDRLVFHTVHPYCAACQQRLRVRRVLRGAFTFFTLFTSIVSIGAAAIVGALLICMLVRAFGFKPADIPDILPAFVLAAFLATLAVVLERLFSARILFPAAVHRLSQRPFALAVQDVRDFHMTGIHPTNLKS